MFLAKNAFATAHTAVSNFAVGHARPHQCGMEEKKLKKMPAPHSYSAPRSFFLDVFCFRTLKALRGVFPGRSKAKMALDW